VVKLAVKGEFVKSKTAYIIAGPNGSGKTTFAQLFLPDYVQCPNFVNADLIAKGLAPFAPQAAAIKAGKLVLQQIHEYANRGVDFAFETTLSGKSYATLLVELKAKGYALHLFFLWIPSVELAIARIKERVAEGGHHIPAQDVRRRFARGLTNFFTLYEPLVDSWVLFDNSKAKPVLIAKRRNCHREIVNDKLFTMIRELRGCK
jgi:predicted ABC-type ATPase